MDERHLAQLLGFLDEDLGRGDITSEAVIPLHQRAHAEVTAGAAGTLAGLEEAAALAEAIDLKVTPRAADGDDLLTGQPVLELDGATRAILGAERTLLNLMSHLSGVATATSQAVRTVEAAHTGCRGAAPPRVAATRKTLPGLRRLQKKAVVIGGGVPHRRDLADAVLVKDNHLLTSPDIADVVRRARQRAASAGVVVEVEVESAAHAIVAARAGADQLLLDNQEPEGVIRIVETLQAQGLRETLLLEASGGITLARVGEYADTGVDVISMGVLTSSPRHIDFSLHLNQDR